MNFSVPRCRRPICGSTRTTISPSSSSTRRRTPCAAGCCGPKLIVKLRILCSPMGSTFRLALSLLVTGQHVVGAFPGREEVEVSQLLRQLDGLIDDTALRVVVANLHEAREREVLPQRESFEAVIGEDAAQVRMPREQHAIKVVGLALVPVRGREQADDRGDGCHLVR